MEFMDSWTVLHEHSAHLQTIYEPHLSTHLVNAEENGVTLPMDMYTPELGSVNLSPGEMGEGSLYRHPVWVIFVLIVGYFLVLVFGVLGNFSVLIVVGRTPRMATVTNLFICNLAIADLLVLVFCIIPNLLSNVFIPWVLGWFLCKTVPYIQGVSVCASVYSLVAISAERCLAIQYPLRTQLTKSSARRCIIGIWIWSLLVAVPWTLCFELLAADEDNPDLEFCVEHWPKGFDFGNYYFLFGNLILCYLLPLGIISLCYLIIYLRVWSRPLPCDAHSRNSSVELIHQKAKAGVLKMLLVVVLMFALSWLPLYLIFSRLKFGGKLSSLEIEIIDIGTPLAQWLGSSNSMWNPWIYAFLNVKFRRAFNTLFCGKRLRRDPTPHFQKPNVNVNIMLKRLRMKGNHTSTSSMFNVTDV